jgi:hypothetical protein
MWSWRVVLFCRGLRGLRGLRTDAAVFPKRALSALESAYEAQSPMMYVAVDSRFQALHGDPRFDRIVSRLHLAREHIPPGQR